jgi:uncharacterized protein (TIGR04255 family)
VYPNREVFANAPLALVAAEIRFTDAARLRQQQTKDEVTIALEQRFPFAQQLQESQITLNMALGSAPSQVQERVGVVLSNAKSTETLTILSGSLIYETTAYAHFDALLEAVTAACDALEAAQVRPALQRIGLRYVDEVRVPEPVTDVRQWAKWIDGNLTSQLTVGPEGSPATAMQSASTYDLGDGKGLNIRSAALNQGSVVVPQFLKRPTIESGPFFVLDFDGFHDFSGLEAVPLTSQVVREALSSVHVPCGSAFQRSITDEARALFRGGPS